MYCVLLRVVRFNDAGILTSPQFALLGIWLGPLLRCALCSHAVPTALLFGVILLRDNTKGWSEVWVRCGGVTVGGEVRVG